MVNDDRKSRRDEKDEDDRDEEVQRKRKPDTDSADDGEDKGKKKMRSTIKKTGDDEPDTRGRRNESDDDQQEEDDDDEGFIGPVPVPEAEAKVKKLEFEKIYLENLPAAETYEKSYMHRDIVTHIETTASDFVITASADGHVKFWKKKEEDVEFVKHFRAHLGNIEDTGVSVDGALYASVGSDKALKVFDVVNFDMINMLKFEYPPGVCQWVYKKGDPLAAIAVSEKEGNTIHIYDGRATNEPLHSLKLHTKPITCIAYNPVHEVSFYPNSIYDIMNYQNLPVPHSYMSTIFLTLLKRT